MLRSELQGALGKAKHALSSKDIVPIFACFAFDGESITAYNDIIGVVTPFKTDLSGAVRGKELAGFLSKCSAKEVEIDAVEDGDVMVVTCGKAKARLGAYGEEMFAFDPPPMKRLKKSASSFNVGDGVLDALKSANRSIGLDPAIPSLYGISIRVEESAIKLFATDNFSFSVASAEDEESLDIEGDPVDTILSPDFMDAFLSLCGSDSPDRMFLTTDWVVVTYKSGTILFGKATEGADVDSLSEKAKELGEMLTEQNGAIFLVPEQLADALGRISVVLDNVNRHAVMTVDKGKLKFLATNKYGDTIRDVVGLKGVDKAVSHGVEVDPSLVESGLVGAEGMTILDGQFLGFYASNFNYYVSSASE